MVHGLSAAAGARRGPGGRLHDHGRRPRRRRAQRSCKQQTENLVRQGQRSSRADGPVLAVSAPTCRMLKVEPDVRECMEKGVNAARFCRHAAGLSGLAVRQRLQSLRPHLAGDRAGRAAVPRSGRGHSRSFKVRNSPGAMVPLGSLASIQRSQRAAGADALQHVSGGGDQRQRQAGRQLGRGDRRSMESMAEAELPTSMAFEWTEMAYLELHGRQHGDDHLRPGRGDGVPGAGGAVRKLVAAAGRDPGRADVPAQRDHRRATWPRWTSTSSRRSASSCWSAWPARTRF